MKKIIIACAGGFAWELSGYLKQDIADGFLKDCTLKGVIDDYTETSKRELLSIPYLGTIKDYYPEPDERVLIAVGNSLVRRKIKKYLDDVHTHYINYIHSSCYVAADAQIATGVIVCPNSVINSGAKLDEFSLVNVFCSVGHGAEVGAFSVLSPYVVINGEAKIGDNCFMGTRSTVFPQISMGDNCVVDSHSFVKSSVDDKKMVSVRGNYLVVDNRLG